MASGDYTSSRGAGGQGGGGKGWRGRAARWISNPSPWRYHHIQDCGLVHTPTLSEILRLMLLKSHKRRGVNVLAEIDVPGHALSWGVGYPDLWPSAECQEPLDVSKEFTFKVIEGILSDFTKVFKFRFVHLGGGDEVNTTCWTNTRIIECFSDMGLPAYSRSC
ncbi:beta-hexosaminidase 1-like isoform X3 [Musa acuminata AAA Group]|uniref:beta-hexosaminidase 1-like isoform X3 n=1 Tax=Musa acuminata AAA Group TaxID=214697 RepID=UPI0031D114F1